ncbi:MAG: type VI secretion system-associated FHA domain protein TagH [Paraburkholderia sp.]|jgi:type VI secretion system FHA domain protein|uniref:type VI secretion system-associated FHA domain protein TagH n=2 Tax=Burkholderiaceae TaxID=119060 RepID=UPI0010F4ED06|nr:type VI secretion system-associated FHA domain protein TagH [Burkholderia sp. 4M9327F10]
MSAAPVLILSIQDGQADRSGGERERLFDRCDGSIGRSEDCDWVLRSDGVSRLHAMVRYLNDIYFIEDRSTNGMVLNDTPLRKGDPVALKHGDRLQIDLFEVSVRLDGEADTHADSQADIQAGGSHSTRGAPSPASAPAQTPVVAPASAENKDSLDLSLLLGPRRAGVPGKEGDAEGLIPGVDAPLPGAVLDPLALFDTSSSYLDAPARSVPPTPAWNHTPAVADRFRPPQREAARADGPVLPEDWDATHSQVAAASAPPVIPVDPAPRHEPAAAITVAPAAPIAPVAPAPSAPPTPANEATGATDASARDLTEMFHIAVDAMMDVLRARAELKNSFRLPATLIQRSENNPLKFAPTAQEAVRKLLAPPGNGFLAGSAALNDAAEDIRHHQMAMLAGVRSAFQSLLAQFDPARIEQETERNKRRLPFIGRSPQWEHYKAQFEEVTRNPDECFQRLFGDEFARAYEEQLGRLKNRRN